MTIEFNTKQTERIKNWLRLYVFPMTRPRNSSVVFEIQKPTYEEVMTDIVSYEFIPMGNAKDAVQLVHYGKNFVLDVTEYENW